MTIPNFIGLSTRHLALGSCSNFRGSVCTGVVIIIAPWKLVMVLKLGLKQGLAHFRGLDVPDDVVSVSNAAWITIYELGSAGYTSTRLHLTSS